MRRRRPFCKRPPPEALNDPVTGTYWRTVDRKALLETAKPAPWMREMIDGDGIRLMTNAGIPCSRHMDLVDPRGQVLIQVWSLAASPATLVPLYSYQSGGETMSFFSFNEVAAPLQEKFQGLIHEMGYYLGDQYSLLRSPWLIDTLVQEPSP